MKQNYSRPIYWPGFKGKSGYLLQRSCTVSNISIRAGTGDVRVQFTDGAGGQTLWDVEADQTGASHHETFDPPMLFKNGLYIVVAPDIDDDNWSISVAVVEPMSSGT